MQLDSNLIQQNSNQLPVEEWDVNGPLLQENVILNAVGIASLYFDACLKVPSKVINIARQAIPTSYTYIQKSVQDTTLSIGETAIYTFYGLDQGLILAANLNAPSLAKRFLDKGANVNEADKQGYRALDYAVAKTKNSEEMVQLLLDHQADTEASEGSDTKPIEIAIVRGNRSIVKCFLRHNPEEIGFINDRGQTLAMSAFQHGFKDLYEELRQQDSGLSQQWLAHKMIVHRFSINLIFKQQRRDLTGANSFLIYHVFRDSLEQHQKSWAKAAPRGWKNDDTQEVLQTMERALSLANSSKVSLDNKVDPALISQTQEDFENGKIIVIPTGWDGHGIVIVISPLGYLIKGDRAKVQAGLEVYELPISSFPMIPSVINQLLENYMEKENKEFINKELQQVLNLKLIYEASRSPQPANTCAWSSSAKLSFQGTLMMQLLKKYETIKGHYPEKTDYSRFEEVTLWAESMYKMWSLEDRYEAARSYIQDIPSSEEKQGVIACLYERLTNKKFGTNKLKHLAQLVNDSCSLIKEYAHRGDAPLKLNMQNYSGSKKCYRIERTLKYRGLQRETEKRAKLQKNYHQKLIQLIEKHQPHLKTWKASKVTITTDSIYPRSQTFEVNI